MPADHETPDAPPLHCRYSQLLREIEQMRGDDAPLALLLIRLAGLDAVNARLGYAAGDQLLDEFAARLRRIARPQDRAMRIGGCSFALLVERPLHSGHVLLAADRVARAAAEPLVIGTEKTCARASIGVSLLPEPASGAEQLLQQCELALTVARRRDARHVLFTPGLLDARQSDAPHTWFDIDEALRAGEFEVFYQPQMDLASGRLLGAEALVRWRKPGAGYIPPGYFLPALEHSQGIRVLLRFVLNAALRQAACWSARHGEFRIAINLAAGNLDDPDLVDSTADALSMWGLPPGQLTLELTESSLMQNPAQSLRTMGQLRDLGLHTSIDDFGTGYSSLAYLRDMPADELKVDRAFIARVLRETRDRDIVASIVQLAHAVQMRVVAEGIEQDATRAALAAMHCDMGQGFLFGPAVTAAEFEARWFGASVASGACA